MCSLQFENKNIAFENVKRLTACTIECEWPRQSVYVRSDTFEIRQGACRIDERLPLAVAGFSFSKVRLAGGRRSSRITSVPSSSHAVAGTLATVRPSGPKIHSSVSSRLPVWPSVFATQHARIRRTRITFVFIAAPFNWSALSYTNDRTRSSRK